MTIFPAPKVEKVREQVEKVLGERGETVLSGNLPPGHKREVRMLGTWIATDGGARMDNDENTCCVQGVGEAAQTACQRRSPFEGARPRVCGSAGQSLVRRSEDLVARRLDQNPDLRERVHQVHDVR